MLPTAVPKPSASQTRRKTSPVISRKQAKARPTAEKKLSPRPFSYLNVFLSIVIITLLYYGWAFKTHRHITAEFGLGYWLGIIGSCAMLLLLVYPIRKHIGFMRRWGHIKYWFQFHMLMGLVGPILVLYHANFSLGSTNSNIAMFSMLVVAGSGVVGRYFYTHTHKGLHGEQLRLQALVQDLTNLKQTLNWQANLDQGPVMRLIQMERNLVKERSFLMAVLSLPYTSLRIRYECGRFRREIKHTLANEEWVTVNSSVTQYGLTIRNIAQLATYEKLFALWHIFHLPLFITLVLAGTAHVVAVHMY